MSKSNRIISEAVATVPITRRRSWRLASLLFACVALPLLISTLLVVAISPALPDWAGSCLFYGGLIMAALLVAGVGESVAVRFLFGARSLTRVEATGLSAVVTGLCQLEVGPPVVDLYASRRPGTQFAADRGRRSVLLSHEFVTAIVASQVTTREAVAAVAHGTVTARPATAAVGSAWTCMEDPRGRPWRRDLAVRHRCMDCDALAGPAAAIAVAIVLALTYIWPRLIHSWGTAVTIAGDRALVAHGLGTPVVTHLRRLWQSRS